MKVKKISNELQYQVKQYLEFYLEEFLKNQTKDVEDCINFLSDDIRDKLLLGK